MEQLLLTLAKEIAVLKAWDADLSYVQVKIRIFKNKRGTTGYSWPDQNLISLGVGILDDSNYSEIEAIGTLIHEYAHWAVFHQGHTEESHSIRFLSFERRAYEEFLGEPLVVQPRDAKAYGGKGTKHHRYAQAAAFVRQLHQKYKNHRF